MQTVGEFAQCKHFNTHLNTRAMLSFSVSSRHRAVNKMMNATYNFLLVLFSFPPPKSPLPPDPTLGRRCEGKQRRSVSGRPGMVKSLSCVHAAMPSHAAPNPPQIEVTGGCWRILVCLQPQPDPRGERREGVCRDRPGAIRLAPVRLGMRPCLRIVIGRTRRRERARERELENQLSD